MKSIVSKILLAILAWAAVVISHSLLATLVTAQTPTSGKLFYMYFDRAIPLTLRQDAIAVTPKLSPSPSNTNIPFYLQLQQDLQETTTSTSRPNLCLGLQLQVKPLRAQDYALVNLLSPNQRQLDRLQQCLEQLELVDSLLPVLKRPNHDELVVVPNEIIISFKPDLAPDEIQAFLERYDFNLIRKLRLSGNCYLVAANSASGIAILDLANQVNEQPEIEYAAPNLIVLPSSYIHLQLKKRQLPKLKIARGTTEGQKNSPPYPHTTLLPWQWYLDSTPLITCLQRRTQLQNCLQQIASSHLSLPSRTDIRALEAWQQSNGGQGVVVAVIDGLIQWDHPDLQQNVYRMSQSSEPNDYPGEIHGWDFIEEDPETRMSDYEKRYLQQQLKDDELGNSEVTLLTAFHGTLVAGVIAAHSTRMEGLLGVAPNVTILPVRAADMEGILDLVDQAEAIEYAAKRGADIINMSFGGDPQHPLLKSTIAQVIAAHPHLVLVAGAGNDNSTEESYPAAYEGVVCVGATTLAGNRAWYSNYGKWIDVVAPGGDVSSPYIYGGILTTGGTWQEEFWQDIHKLLPGQSYAFDPKGEYMWVQGTSFATPVVSGVLALMKGEDQARHLSNERLVTILKETASYDHLTIYNSQQQDYRYFFGSGLVNAEAALKAIN